MNCDEKSGLWYRDQSDLDVIREVNRDYVHLPVQKGDVCLDLGAHIGAASCLMVGMGAALVVAVEPDPTSCELLRFNTAHLPVELLQGAVGPTSGPGVLHILPTRRSMNNTRRSTNKRVDLRIRTYALSELLARYKPDVLKCDIEFGEYPLAAELAALPDGVRAIAMELHLKYGNAYETAELRSDAGKIMDAYYAQGYELAWSREFTARYVPVAEGDARFSPYATSISTVWVRP